MEPQPRSRWGDAARACQCDAEAKVKERAADGTGDPNEAPRGEG